jgi:hypothetical protein
MTTQDLKTHSGRDGWLDRNAQLGLLAVTVETQIIFSELLTEGVS